MAASDLKPGHYICRYEGELLSYRDGLCRYNTYQKGLGSYMIEFRCGERRYWLDATTRHLDRPGRFMNHSIQPNCRGRVTLVDGKPAVYFVARQFIISGTELTWDYFETNKETQKHFTFLKRTFVKNAVEKKPNASE